MKCLHHVNKAWVLRCLVLFVIAIVVGFLVTIALSESEDSKSSNENNPLTGTPSKLFDINEKLNVVVLAKDSHCAYRVMRKKGNADNWEIEQEVLIEQITANEKLTIVSRANGATLTTDKHTITFDVDADQADFSMIRVKRYFKRGEVLRDCFNLDDPTTNWFGGPEQMYQYWPVQRMKFKDYSYLSKEADSAGVAERYWLSSRGLFVYVTDRTPLFINQNVHRDNHLCMVVKKELPFYIHDTEGVFEYVIGIASDARAAHMEAVRRILNKPTGIPDERMVRLPIWSTWVRYGRGIDETIIRDFAKEIRAHGFKDAQLDIDDLWERCYGSTTFGLDKFPRMRNLTDDLHADGFRVTLWIHPFINKRCEPEYSFALEKGYLVLGRDGSPDTKWWNSGVRQAAYIDFTNPEAVEWFTAKLERLQVNEGIDNFKFDAGETSWTPSDPVLRGPTDFYPNQLTVDYVRMCAKFGEMIEIRAGQGTQDLPVFIRMLDLDSRWTWNNGLPTLITTLLQMNMNGYPFVLPDMVGGNNYNDDEVTKELFIRWLQANVFMPSIQFSIPPWEFDGETVELSLKFLKMHEDESDVIINLFKRAVESGEPVNTPIWWLDPTDATAQTINDEFLLGHDLLAAPVVDQGVTERDIYLPKGQWKDGNSATIYDGPMWILAYPAPLNILPYFRRMN